MNTHTYFGADGFNCDAYGQYAYNECAVQGTADNGGGLSFTGDLMIIPLALGAAIVIASVILLVKKLRRSKKS